MKTLENSKPKLILMLKITSRLQMGTRVPVAVRTRILREDLPGNMENRILKAVIETQKIVVYRIPDYLSPRFFATM